MKNIYVFAIGLLLSNSQLFAQQILPIAQPFSVREAFEQETLNYARHSQDGESRQTVHIDLEDVDGYLMYRVDIHRSDADISTWFMADSLIPMRELWLHRTEDWIYREERELQGPGTLEPGELLVMSTVNLLFLLRAYPFDNARDIPIRLLGQGSQDDAYSIEVVHRRTEQLEIDGRMFTAHKLEIVTRLPGALSMFRGLVPHTFLWFEADGPHRLLRYEGSDGLGKDGEFVLELIPD